MAKMTLPRKVDLNKLPRLYRLREALHRKIREKLIEGLEIGGIRADVETEPVKGTKLFRVTAISPQFAAVRPLERQDLVWRIIADSLTRNEQLRISTILTLTPAEASGKW